MKKKVLHYKTVTVIILIGLVLFFIAFDFRLKLENQLDKQAVALLSRRVDMIADVINNEFSEQFEILESLAEMIVDHHHDEEQIISMLNNFNDNASSRRLTYTDINGNSILEDGMRFSISDRLYFQETINNGYSITFVQQSYVDGMAKVILSKAIFDTNDQFSGMLSSIYDDQSFYDLFSDLDYEVYVLMSGIDGQVMIDINMKDEPIKIDNVFEFYESVSTYDEEIASKIKLDVKAGLSDIMVIGKGLDRHYVSYFNVDHTDWMIFTAVPYMTIWTQFNAIEDISMGLFIQILMVFMIIVLLVYYFEYKKREEIAIERRLLQRSEERYRILDKLTQSMIIEGDFKSDTITFLSNHETIFGYSPRTRRISDYLSKNPYIHQDDICKIQKFIDDLKRGTTFTAIDCRLISKNDVCFWSRVTGISLMDTNNDVIGFIARVTNRDEQIKQINTLKDAASKDSLTKIANRDSIESQVNEYILSRNDQKEIAAFFVIDMDNFKDVNDKQGHLIGDKLLIEIASTMDKMFRKSDFVGRLGGDEFAVFMCDVPSIKTVTDKADELLKNVSEIMKGYNNNNHLSCSIGIAIAYDNKELFEQLYIRADQALYRSKAKGKNQYIIDDIKKGDRNDRV
ncbi:MAG: sensor domain-containing diguanylate cyclase [Erysipelotrichaceae bacterium]|nr:sensor domain-containing diguanylate cyclase [Erysipelotrichaceae bacterium]MDD4642680.1 sensor domain-containing diguanylate cyclase [Erysipelotrichaceae bacterium]